MGKVSAVARRAKAEAIHRAASGEMDCVVAYAPLRKRFAFVAGNDVDKSEYDKREILCSEMRFARSNQVPDRLRDRDRTMGLLVGVDPDDLAGHERLSCTLEEDGEFEGEA